tara:strand:- start:2443 stop:2607 length:165 start_codon:yes stop_codon:yes gene_type:complete
MKEWIMGRVREPSTYAAVAIGLVGVGVLSGNFWIVISGMVIGVGSFVLKEKGVL